MSDLRKLYSQFSHYILGSILTLLAGILTYLVYTRILTVEEYGIYSLVLVTISIIGLVAVCGLPQAAVRFYHEFKERKREEGEQAFYSTLLFGVGIISTIVTVTGFFLLLFLNYFFISLTLLAFLALPLVVTNSVILIVFGYFRAEQRTLLYNIFMGTRPFLTLLFAVIFILGLKMGLTGLFIGWLLFEILLTIILIAILIREKKLAKNAVSSPFFKEAFHYGFPLIFAAISNLVLRLGDRYVIQLFEGSESVGIYTAGYNIPKMMSAVLILPLSLALGPIVMEYWVKKGEEATKNLLSTFMRYMLMGMIPITFGLILLSKEAVYVLATSKFESAETVIPYVAVGMGFLGLYYITSMGLQIYKKTRLQAVIIAFCAVLNIVLNFIFVPYYGINGAAIATLLSYGALFVIITFYSLKCLKFKIPFVSALKYTAISAAVFFLLYNIHIEDAYISIAIKSSVGVFLYVSLIALFDRDARKILGDLIKPA